MTIESEALAALRQVEAEKSSPWSLHATSLAHGIEKSGVPALLGNISDSLGAQSRTLIGIQGAAERQLTLTEHTNSAIMALAAVNAAGFEGVCGVLAETNSFLSGIERSLANPLSTAAAERYRRGIHALSQEWYEPALKELDASIELDPFQAVSHFARGLALGSLKRRPEALEAFRDAMTFTGKDPALLPVLAGSAILAAQTASDLGMIEDARAILEVAVGRVPDCGEVQLAHANLTGDCGSLDAALRIAPELAIAAVAGGVPDTEDVAERVASDPAGPIGAMRSAADSLASLGAPVPVPTQVPDAMTFHRAWRDEYVSATRVRMETLLSEERSAEAEFSRAERQLADVPRAHEEDKWRRALRRDAIWLGLCLAVLIFSVLFIAANPRSPNMVVAFLIVLSALGTLFTGWMTLGTSGDAAKERRSNRWAREQESERRSEAANAVAMARKVLDEARARATRARGVLCQLDKSVPRRVYPLTFARPS